MILVTKCKIKTMEENKQLQFQTAFTFYILLTFGLYQNDVLSKSKFMNAKDIQNNVQSWNSFEAQNI